MSETQIFFLVLFVVSVFRALTVATLFHGDPLGRGGDAAQYHYFGLSIAEDTHWVSKHLGVVPPLYPLFLAAVYLVAGDCPLCALMFRPSLPV